MIRGAASGSDQGPWPLIIPFSRSDAIRQLPDELPFIPVIAKGPSALGQGFGGSAPICA